MIKLTFLKKTKRGRNKGKERTTYSRSYRWGRQEGGLHTDLWRSLLRKTSTVVYWSEVCEPNAPAGSGYRFTVRQSVLRPHSPNTAKTRQPTISWRTPRDKPTCSECSHTNLNLRYNQRYSTAAWINKNTFQIKLLFTRTSFPDGMLWFYW